MNRLKSFKNYITSTAVAAASSTGIVQESDVINVKQPNRQTSISYRKNSADTIVLTSNVTNTQTLEQIDTNTNDSFKLFNVNNLHDDKILCSNDNDTNNNDKNSKTNNSSRPKFLRSKSIEERHFKLKNASSTNNAGKRDNEPQSDELFTLLDKNLENLIEHFKPSDYDPNSPPLAQSQDSSCLLPSPQYMDTSDTSALTYFKLVIHAKLSLAKCVSIYHKLEKNCSLFDYESGRIKSNGYRSILATFEACCKRSLLVVNDLNEKKSSFFFQLKLNTTLPVNSSLKELQAWVKLLEKFEIIMQISLDMQNISMTKIDSNSDVSPSLFINAKELYDSSIETSLFYLGSIYQDAFFGRSCGFQFCESLQIPLTGCAVALASYNDGYEAYSNKENYFSVASTVATTVKSSSPTQNSINSSPVSTSPTITTNYFSNQATLFKSLFSGTKYILDPELRAKKIARVIKDANVEFCKAFWQLTETSIVQMGSNLITPQLAVNIVKKINLNTPLKLPRVEDGKTVESTENFVIINPPKDTLQTDTVQIRLLSSEMRVGMLEFDNVKSTESSVLLNNFINFPPSMNNFSTTTPNSPYLILHIHGGGFIAQSSKSHEIYLKPWCKELKIPIVSIDYSLAPEHAFPRGSEECFYVYAWCLLNKQSLGWTGEKIILVGDSAGGVLVTNIVQRAIKSEIRIPDALIPIYAPFQLTYSLSPSRLLAVMDPLLNLGILWRCLAAYCGIDFKMETEKFKTFLNLTDEKPKLSPVRTTLTKSLSLKAFLSRSLTPSPNLTTPSSETQASSNELIARNTKCDTPSPDYESEEDTNKISKSVSYNDDFLKQPLEEDKPQTEEFVMDETHKKHLLHLYKVLGDSVFLVEKLRDNPLTHNEFMSPMFTDDSILSKFPQTFLIASNDPFLDDNIEMAKRLKSLNVPFEIIIIDNQVGHAFLNLHTLTKETTEAFEQATTCIRNLIASYDAQLHHDKASTNY